MWGAALCQMLLDALDGPMPIPNDAEEELQSRYMSYYQVDQMDDMFCFACDAIGLEPDAIRESFRAGHMTRDRLYYVMGRFTRD